MIKEIVKFSKLLKSWNIKIYFKVKDYNLQILSCSINYYDYVAVQYNKTTNNVHV